MQCNMFILANTDEEMLANISVIEKNQIKQLIYKRYFY